MSYLLWQIFWCLLGTATLFFALGWLVRSWYKRNTATDSLITDSERSSWQTSLDGLKARLEAETGRKLAAEKALEDARGQQAKLSSLLDQHATEIKTLTQELADRDSKLTGMQPLTDENAKLKAQIAEVAPRLAAAVAAGSEITSLQSHSTDLETQLKASLDTNAKLEDQISELQVQADKLQAAESEVGKLKTQVADLTPKLAMAAAAGTEVIALKAQVAQLEPQVSKLQNSDTELSQLRSQLLDLQQKLQASTAQEGELNKKFSILQTSSADATKHLGDVDAANKALAAENQRIKAQLAERDAKLNAAAEEVEKLKAQADEAGHLKTQLAAATAAAAEIFHLKSHISELEGKLNKAQASEAEMGKFKEQIADLQGKLAELQAKEAEAGRLGARLADLEPQLADREAKLKAHTDESQKFKLQLADLTPKLAAATAAADELASFKKRWVEHEGKLKLVDEENGRLKARLAEFESLQKEVHTLRLRVTSLEPQVHEWETRYSTTVAQKDIELSQCRSKVAELEHAKPAAVHHPVPAKAERDDLKKIYGIGPVLEKRLNDLGVYFFREIAMWTKEDVLRYEEHLKEFPDRIERDHWVEGAREEHFKKYGERLLKADSASA